MNYPEKVYQQYQALQAKLSTNFKRVYWSLKVGCWMGKKKENLAHNFKITTSDVDEILALDTNMIDLIDYSNKYKIDLLYASLVQITCFIIFMIIVGCSVRYLIFYAFSHPEFPKQYYMIIPFAIILILYVLYGLMINLRLYKILTGSYYKKLFFGMLKTIPFIVKILALTVFSKINK